MESCKSWPSGERAKSRCFTHGPTANHNFSQPAYNIAVFDIPDNFKCFQVFFIYLIVIFWEHTQTQNLDLATQTEYLKLMKDSFCLQNS